MSENPRDLLYTRSHEWIRRLADGRIEVGITHHAQGALGDLVFVEVPAEGRQLEPGEACAVVESVKAASDVYSPVGGRVAASNGELASRPELLNEDPYGAGWLFRVLPAAGAAAGAAAPDGQFMSAEDYDRFLAEQAH